MFKRRRKKTGAPAALPSVGGSLGLAPAVPFQSRLRGLLQTLGNIPQPNVTQGMPAVTPFRTIRGLLG